MIYYMHFSSWYSGAGGRMPASKLARSATFPSMAKIACETQIELFTANYVEACSMRSRSKDLGYCNYSKYPSKARQVQSMIITAVAA